MKLTKLFILFLFLSFKGFSQQTSSYTLKYDKTEFCAGSNEFSKPIIIDFKGEVIENIKSKAMNFSITKVSGEGNLSINSDGVINISKSNFGSYRVNLINGIGSASTIISSFDIKLNNCN